MLIKICGLKQREDLAACIELGVEAFGLMFVPGSARYVGLEMAAGLSQQARGKIQRVGVFQDATPETVQAVLAEVELDVLQFHGSESAAFCASFGMPYVKVIAVRAGDSIDVDNAITQHRSSCGLLLDTASGEGSGGTGQTFDWSAWPSDSARGGDLPLYLAGGLTPDNVARAIALTMPAGVDVSGGVEGAQRGVKNPDRIAAFVTAVRAAARALG
ncbi:MAG: phosphoribosylanthranilate isomerase [Pseudomonadaceae bacterium]|nr:phosphoribosylanthranilate isomerase [Pseudomonadaceae bacterium]